MPDEKFIEIIQKLAELPDNAFWRESFSRYVTTRAMDAEKLERLGRAAQKCGAELADEYSAEAGADIAGLYSQNNLKIRELEIPNSMNMQIFALFEPPDTVSIRADIAKSLDDYAASSGLRAVLGSVKFEEVILAHEFFHFLEGQNSSIFTRRYTEPRGLFHRKTGLPALSEIGAMSFSKKFNGLSWSPFLLDCVMLSMTDICSAVRLAERLLSAAEYE